MIESKDLELQTALTMGTLTTNAAKIKAVVDAQLENYKPELYVGKADEAKRDRAELNKAADTLNKKRQEIEREFMQPFADFKAIINDAVKSIKAASSQLDAIVKTEEQREKDEKFQQVREIWDGKGCQLVPLAKIFNPKWLNKTAKLSNINKEIDEIIAGILQDLAVIDNFAAEDVPLIKACYLESLSLSAATMYAQTLQDNRERLTHEQEARRDHAVQVQLDEQRREEHQEAREHAVNTATSMLEFVDGRLVEPIAQVEPEPLESYALLFTGTYEQLAGLKRYMTANGITYTKLDDAGDGTFTM